MNNPNDAMARRRFILGGLLTSAGACAAIAGYTVFLERYWVKVTKLEIPVRGLPEAFRGFKIVHVTDIHYGPLMSLDHTRHVLDLANSLGADVIALTGDYVHRSDTDQDFPKIKPYLARLKAPDGVFGVLGNHDHWANGKAALKMMEDLGISLVHKKIAIERNGSRIWFTGTGDLWEDRTSIDEIQIGIPEDETRILLCHNPDTCDTAWKSRVDLTLSGHTHGGQIVIPFIGPLVLPVENKRYSSGLIKTEKTTVFISRGLGWAIYPVRFNCRPEIPILTLVPA